MTLLLPAQTLRSLAAALRQLNYVPPTVRKVVRSV